MLWQRWSWWSPLSLHAGVELAQCLTCDVARPIRGHFAVGQALLSLELKENHPKIRYEGSRFDAAAILSTGRLRVLHAGVAVGSMAPKCA